MRPTVMIIRHGEKQLTDQGPFGVALDGTPDQQSLTVRGWQRAGAVVGLFVAGAEASAPKAGIARLPIPTALFASRVGETTSRSRRPRETLDPLSARLELPINQQFLKEQITELAAAIEACSGPVLVAWEHKMIPPLTTALIGDASRVPQLWPDDRYDMTWVVEPDADGTGYDFRQVPQCLLAGDDERPF